MHGRLEMCTKFGFESLNGRDHLEHLNIDGRIILKWILGKEGSGWGLDKPGSGQRLLTGSCFQSNEPLGSMKGREYLD
jgi:hypothetical protein